MTLDRLTNELLPWVSKIQAVHDVYVSGVVAFPYDSKDTSSTSGANHNCLRASLLLNALYQAVLEADLASLGDQFAHVGFSSSLFFFSSCAH